jgi:hypothetical protein
MILCSILIPLANRLILPSIFIPPPHERGTAQNGKVLPQLATSVTGSEPDSEVDSSSNAMTDLWDNILGAANGLGNREIVPNHITDDHLSLP